MDMMRETQCYIVDKAAYVMRYEVMSAWSSYHVPFSVPAGTDLDPIRRYSRKILAKKLDHEGIRVIDLVRPTDLSDITHCRFLNI